MAANEFKISRIFNAPRELVFQAWTDPKLVHKWWGPANFTAPTIKIDFRVGGKFHFCMRAPDGKEYWNGGVYKEIIVPEKIIQTMYFSNKDGNKVPSSQYFGSDEYPSETTDVVTFEVYEKNKTKLTLLRDHSEAIAKKFGEIEGWSQSLDRFEKILQK
jgi:uncharacterized protein YndB with AHSA1/START domain